MTTPSPTTLVMNLKKAVNPTWFTQDQLGAIQPMPVPRLGEGVGRTARSWTSPSRRTRRRSTTSCPPSPSRVGTYATNPLWQVVDGPYKLTSFNNTTGAFTMAPNPKYGGPHAPKYPTLSRPCRSPRTPLSTTRSSPAASTSATSRSTDLPQVRLDQAQLQRVRLPRPSAGATSRTTSRTRRTTSTRSSSSSTSGRRSRTCRTSRATSRPSSTALAAQAYGPVPSVPASPFTPSNATTNPYPFSVDAAANLLKSHGWTVNPGGTNVCKSAGSGANQCGAGIPAGQKLEFTADLQHLARRSPARRSPTWPRRPRRSASRSTCRPDNFNHMISTYNDPSPPEDHRQVGDGGLRRVHQLDLPDHVRRVQQRRVEQPGRLLRPEGRQADPGLHRPAPTRPR